MSSLTSTRLESLSNEILLEIFEYLDGYTLCSVFYGMNWRLRNLLRLCQLHIRFDKNKRDKRVWDTLATCMNPTRIYALSLYGVVIHERFLPSNSENLVSLYFYRMNRDSIDRILRHLPTVNRIKTLGICQKGGRRPSFLPNECFCDYVFLEHGNRLTSLVNCSLKGFHDANEFPIIADIFSKLRRLSLSNFSWTSNLAQFLRENTPNLRSLYFHRDISFLNESIPSVIKHIRELDMNARIDLWDILPTLPGLKRLRILCNNAQLRTIADGTQWQNIIEKYLPCLQYFTLDFATGIDEDIAKTFYIGEFWSARKVVIKLVMDKVHSRYRKVKTIYFWKQWRFKYFDWDEVKPRSESRNPNLRLQSSSTSHIRSQSRSSSPPTPPRYSCLRSPSPLRLRAGSRSPLVLHSRSRSRSRPHLRPRPQSRSRLRPHLRPQSRSRSRSRPHLRPRSQSRSRLRPYLRPRSRSRSRLRPHLRPQSQSHSRSRPHLRPRSQSRSRLRPHLRLRSPSPSQSRSRLRSRLQRRSPSRSQSRRRLRLRPRPRSTPQSRSRLRPRLQRRSPSRSRSRSRSRLRLRPRPRAALRVRPRPRLRLRSRSPSQPRSRARLR